MTRNKTIEVLHRECRHVADELHFYSGKTRWLEAGASGRFNDLTI